VNVAVISDTHLPRGARRLPADCLARLQAADLVLHAGDVVARPVLEELQALGPPVHAVQGNMDDAELQALLPRTAVVEAAGARIGMIHDPGPPAGRGERLVRRFPGCAAVVYGHTHEPEVSRHDGMWILNPGSPTERRRAPSKTMGMATVEDGRVSFELVTVG
jgi:uncharacterized protein